VGGWGEGRDVIRRGEVDGREVGRKEKFWGRREAEKTNNSGQGDVFLLHPKIASTASSSTGALVAAGSLQPQKRLR
jgi:hypothetical protein